MKTTMKKSINYIISAIWMISWAVIALAILAIVFHRNYDTVCSLLLLVGIPAAMFDGYIIGRIHNQSNSKEETR